MILDNRPIKVVVLDKPKSTFNMCRGGFRQPNRVYFATFIHDKIDVNGVLHAFTLRRVSGNQLFKECSKKQPPLFFINLFYHFITTIVQTGRVFIYRVNLLGYTCHHHHIVGRKKK